MILEGPQGIKKSTALKALAGPYFTDELADLGSKDSALQTRGMWIRQCVFAGTVNHSTYLRDDTGARRFWPVVCGCIDVEHLTRDRDQLWAEAKARFDQGAVWWLETAELVTALHRSRRIDLRPIPGKS